MAEGLSAVARTGRHAAHVTAATAAGFYPALHLLDRPVAGIYALFTPIAFGILSPLPGAGRDRAATVLRAVPAAAVLVVLGTVLAVGTWPAVAGMLAVGFALAFGAACGPRIAGAAPGSSSSTSWPASRRTRRGRCRSGSPGSSSAGRSWPWPRRCSSRTRRSPRTGADRRRPGPGGPRRLRSRPRGGPDPETAGRLGAAGRELRLSRLPAGARPTGAGRTDRALAQAGPRPAGSSTNWPLAAHDPAPGDTVSAELLRGSRRTAGRRPKPCGGGPGAAGRPSPARSSSKRWSRTS